MSILIVGFTGTRHGMTHPQWEGVKRLLEEVEPYEVHHGDCVGADEEFHQLAMQLNLRTVIHPPIIHTLRAYCQGDLVLKPKDYTARNRDIVQVSEFIIAAPPTEQEQQFGGTWQTVRFSREYNRPCKVVLPSGNVVDA